MSTEISTSSLAVNPLALDLDRVLSQFDSETAVFALALAERRAADGRATDALGYPAGYFEATARRFANEPLEAAQE